MTVKLLTEHHLRFLSLKGGCTGTSKSTLVKTPHCWKSRVKAHFQLQLDLSRRDQRTDDLQNKIQGQKSLIKTLKTQIKELNDRFRVVDETGVRMVTCL